MYMYVYMYLLLVRVYVHVYMYDRLGWFVLSTCFPLPLPRFSSPSSPVPFSLLCLLPVPPPPAEKCLVAAVCNRHTIHRFLRSLIATRAGIHYTSDFLSISCGAPRNLRFEHCQMIFQPVRCCAVADLLESPF